MSDIKINKDVEEAFESGKAEAERLINDPDKMEIFLQRLEQKLDDIPVVGEQLSMVPVMISMIKSYVKKEYTDVPVQTIVAMVAALLYLISPKDLIKDSIPVLGLLDDIAVIALSWRYTVGEADKYQQWRREQGLESVFFNESEEEQARKEKEIERAAKFNETVEEKTKVAKEFVTEKAGVAKDFVEDKFGAAKDFVEDKIDAAKDFVEEKKKKS